MVPTVMKPFPNMILFVNKSALLVILYQVQCLFEHHRESFTTTRPKNSKPKSSSKFICSNATCFYDSVIYGTFFCCCCHFLLSSKLSILTMLCCGALFTLSTFSYLLLRDHRKFVNLKPATLLCTGVRS